MRIGSTPIGPDHAPYIIAELGVNHDGSVERALELVDAAAEAGADAIKLQLFEADRLMSKAAKLAAYQKAAGESDPVAMLRRLELSVDQMAPIVARAHDRGIHAIVTVFSVELVDDAERLPWDAYKTASPDIVHKPLLDRLMRTGKPLIVSTGASTMEEVVRAITWLDPEYLVKRKQPHAFGDSEHEKIAVLQCVSAYPTPLESASLEGIFAIGAELGWWYVLGYSDHTSDERTGAKAIGSLAAILEKHFTYDRGAAGPDHAASLDAKGLKRYIDLVSRSFEIGNLPSSYRPQAYEITIDGTRYGLHDFVKSQAEAGEDQKVVLPMERDVRTVSRQSLTTTRELPAGHIVTLADITFKRPGTGLLPFELDRAIGRRLVRNVEADMPLMETDLGS